MALEVELYEGKTHGKALSPTHPQTLEEEIFEHELIAKHDLSVQLGMTGLSADIDWRLKRLRYQRELPFPLFTEEEERIWADFLPTRYTTDYAKSNQWLYRVPSNWRLRQLFVMEIYRFDLPPLSILEFWRNLREKKQMVTDELGTEYGKSVFDTYEIWTPELPRPEPILVGYKDSVGPFLLAQWGESLQEFEDIKREVEKRRQMAPVSPIQGQAQWTTIPQIPQVWTVPNTLSFSGTTGTSLTTATTNLFGWR